ncbi:MAG: peptidyl-prolyl cis-trans isomerase [Terriglobales bacterium]
MPVRCIAVLVALAGSALAQQPGTALLSASHNATPTVVARVNGAPLFERDLQVQVKALFPYYSVHGGQVPVTAQAEIRQKALDRLVLEELVYQEAKRRGVKVSPAQVNGRIAAARNKAASAQDFRRSIIATYGSEREFRRYAERALLIETLWEREVSRASQPSAADLLKTYREHRRDYTLPEAVKLQTISFQVAEKASAAEREQVRKRAEEVLRLVKATSSAESFGALAAKHSQDDWRVMNGDHGWVHRGTVEASLESAFAMRPGQVSDIVTTSFGFHILRVNDYRPARQLSFAEARATIRKALQKERETQLRQRFEQQLRREAKVEVQ